MLLSMCWRPSTSRHSQLSGMYLRLAIMLLLSWQDQDFSSEGSLTIPLWWLSHIWSNWFSCSLSTCLFYRQWLVNPKMLKCLAFRAVYVFPQCYEKQSYCCALLTCSNFSFSNTFHILRPTKAPGFVYAWLELISHRIFIARMLAHTPQQKVWLQFISSELKGSHRCLSGVVLFHLSKCTTGMAVLFLLSSIFTVT